MKKSTLLALLSITLCITACNNKKNKEDVDPNPLKEDEVEVRLPHSMNSDAKDYPVRVRFDDNFFKEDAKTFNKELAMLSLANTFAASDSMFIEEFYGRLKFDTNIKYTNYGITPTEDTVGYSIAHKQIGEYDLLAISVRGFNYGKEWANNFLIGEEGNHYGFEARANEIYNDLKIELEVRNYENVKLWITGYSRGGGISNVLSHKILSSDEIDIAPEDMYVYTFEAPRGLTEENAVAYENVHNVINKADLITYVAPEQYGLYRCGVDVQIYTADSNISRLLYDLDKDIVFPTFTATTDYDDEQGMIEWLFAQLTADGKEADASMHTREDFVNNYQTAISYMLGFFFSLPNATSNKLMDKLSNATLTEMLSLLSDDGIYNFIKPVLDEDHISYDDATFKANCAVFTKLLQNNVMLLYSIAGSDAGKSNIQRCIYMHMPEAEYVLLKDLKIY